MYANMVAYGPLQCDEVVQGLLLGEALTLPHTSLASVWSGDNKRASKHSGGGGAYNKPIAGSQN